MKDTAAAVCLSESVIEGLPESVEVLSLARAGQAFQALEEWLLSSDTRQLPLHEVEREQERRGREIQRLLLEAHVAPAYAGGMWDLRWRWGLWRGKGMGGCTPKGGWMCGIPKRSSVRSVWVGWDMFTPEVSGCILSMSSCSCLFGRFPMSCSGGW